MTEFPAGAQGRLLGLKAGAELNGLNCVSLGPASTSGRLLVRLGTGRELAVRAENLALAGAAGTLPVRSRVVLAGLAKAPTLNGKEGVVVGLGEAGSGRLRVEICGEGEGDEPPAGEAKDEQPAREVKALKVENLVLAVNDEPATAEPKAEGEAGFDLRNEKEKKAARERAAALEACPLGSKVRIHGLVEEQGRGNTGDPALNGQEGVVDRADPDEPDRLIIKLPAIKTGGRRETPLKSISYENLTWLDAPPPKKEEVTTTSLQVHAHGKRNLDLATQGSGTTLSAVGAGGKRCKITEIAVAGGDKTAAFASAARRRDGLGSGDQDDSEAVRSNATIYAKNDVASPDDEVAGAGIARLIQLNPNFAMKSICILGADVAANGTGKIGSKSVAVLEGLAAWLTGGESDGILRRQLKEGQACAGESDGLAACRRCAERGLKGGRLLGIVRRDLGAVQGFVQRGCKER